MPPVPEPALRLETYRREVAAFRATPPVPDDPDAELARASAAARLGNVALAVAIRRVVLSQQPEHREAGLAVAAGLTRLGDYVTAEKQYRKVLERHPHSIEGWLGLAVARSRSGDRAGARQAVAEARRRATSPEERRQLAIGLLNLREPGTARQLLERTADTPEDEALLGAIFAGLSRPKEAIEHLRRAWEASGDSRTAVLLAQQLLVGNPDAQARRRAGDLLEAARDEPDTVASFERARLAVLEERWADAAAEVVDCLTLDPRHVDARALYGQVARRLGHTAAAEVAFAAVRRLRQEELRRRSAEAAIRRRGAPVSAWRMAASVQERQGDAAAALETLQRAAVRHPGDRTLRVEAAALARRLGWSDSPAQRHGGSL